jgi:aspartyl/asparaginyl beta-hydroxylase (cupin superfamily)
MLDSFKLKELVFSALDNSPMTWQSLNNELSVENLSPKNLNNYDVWYYLNVAKNIQGNSSILDHPEFASQLLPTSELFYVRFYDKNYPNDIPASAGKRFVNVNEYLKQHEFIQWASLYFIGPNTNVPSHVDNEPTQNILVGVIVPDGVYITVDGKDLQIMEGDAISFDPNLTHSAKNNTHAWWVLLQIHVSN